MHMNRKTAHLDAAAAFKGTLVARRDIGRAIWRARWHAQHTSHTIIRVVPMQPERKTWYECTTCGRAGTTTWNNQPHCARCGALAHQHAWVQPDIAAAERRAWERRRWQRRRQSWRERATPWTERRDRYGTRATAGLPTPVATCRALPR